MNNNQFNNIELICDYSNTIQDICLFNVKSIYKCGIKGQVIPKNLNSIKFLGQHIDEKTNENVTAIDFYDCTLSKIPQGLTAIFPNLRYLTIIQSKLKSINRQCLAEYRHLERIRLNYNEIEYLPGDLFNGFMILEEFSICGNDLKVIEPNIFDGLDNLRFVDLEENTNYNIKFQNDGFYLSEKLNELRSHLFEKFFSRLEFLKIFMHSYDILLKDYQKQNFQLQKGMLADLRMFTEDENTKDFKIIIDDREFYVHKFLLAARSPTLAEMIRQNPEADYLKLVDIPINIFEVILKFLYTDEFPHENDTAFLQIFAAAGRLKIEELKNYAAAELLSQINLENAIEIHQISNKYEHPELKQKAFYEIKKIYSKLEFKDEWVDDAEKLTQVIQLFNKKEETVRKAEEDYENFLNGTLTLDLEG